MNTDNLQRENSVPFVTIDDMMFQLQQIKEIYGNIVVTVSNNYSIGFRPTPYPAVILARLNDSITDPLFIPNNSYGNSFVVHIS